MLTTRNAFSKTGPDPTSSANVATEKETPVISSLTASSSPKSGLNWTPTQTVLPSSKSPAQPKWLSPNSAFCSQPMPRTSPRNPLGCLVSQKSIPWRTADSGMTVRLTASLRPCGQPPSALLFIRTDHARCCYSTVVSTTLMCLPLRFASAYTKAAAQGGCDDGPHSAPRRSVLTGHFLFSLVYPFLPSDAECTRIRDSPNAIGSSMLPTPSYSTMSKNAALSAFQQETQESSLLHCWTH